MTRQDVATALLILTLAVGAGPRSVVAQTSSSYGPEAKACTLMPTPELEASFGGKVTNPHGTDSAGGSICTVNIGGLAVSSCKARCRERPECRPRFRKDSWEPA